jgi:hypothetical protein
MPAELRRYGPLPIQLSCRQLEEMRERGIAVIKYAPDVERQFRRRSIAE